MPTKKFLALLFCGHLMMNSSHAALANQELMPPPLATASPVTSENTLDDENYQRLLEGSEKSSGSSLTIKNITPRQTVEKLELVTGKTSVPQQKVWGFIVDDERQVYEVGSVIPNGNREFSFLVPSRLSHLQGKIVFVATLVSDLRLAIPLPEKTSVVTFYQSSQLPKTATESDKNPNVLIKDVQFTQGAKPLQQLQGRYLEVYANSFKDPITVDIQGEIFASQTTNLRLSSVLLPSLKQEQQNFSDSSPHLFTARVNLNEFHENEETQIILIASEEIENILAPSSGSYSGHQVLSFRVRRATDEPQVLKVLWESNKGHLNTWIIIGCLLSWALIAASYRHQSGWAKTLSVLIIIGELGFIGNMAAINTFKALIEHGLMEIPGQEKIILRQQSEEIARPTITRLDENLEIRPALSTSWSNISPHVWEFVLRKDITAEAVIAQLQKKIRTSSSERRYLTSIKNMISVNASHLQIITQFPDPLLAQKLTRVTLETKVDAKSLTSAYLPLENSANAIRLEKNQNYFDLPFLKNPAEFQTIVQITQPDAIKELIKEQKIDVFDEPETKLWPTLLQNNYEILPKINTESVVIMTDRNSFYLREPAMVTALKKILQGPKILQTSYFQYGQLANQFTPPGVTGYDPKLQTPIAEGDIAEMLDQAKKKLQTGEITLTFQYPEEEQILAEAVQNVLEQSGIRVVSEKISHDDLENTLLKRTTDLSLLPLQFDIGDAGPFLDTLIDSSSPYNKTYQNAQVDKLIQASRTELNHVKRLELLQQIMHIIIVEDPAGIPLLFKKSFIAQKKVPAPSWWEQWLQQQVLGWH